MEFTSHYIAHKPDAMGEVKYNASENKVWQMLYERQLLVIPRRACDEFLDGLEHLQLTATKIPQLPDVNARLSALTGWEVVPVEALISARAFFKLLSTRHFPAATFIRTGQEINYVKEPDIFHELFGHCPMLTNSVYANFLYEYANIVLSYPEHEWPLLQRLFWYTVEFGLLKTSKGLRAYGGGILSSVTETPYSIESDLPLRVLFAPVVALRMPYRIDRLQTVYFVIDDLTALYNLLKIKLSHFIGRAQLLGEYPPLFPSEEGNPNIHIHAC